MATKLEELEAAVEEARDAVVAARDAATYDAAVAAETAIWSAYDDELKKIRQENSND